MTSSSKDGKSNLASDLLKGSREINRMREEILHVMTMLKGLIPKCDHKNLDDIQDWSHHQETFEEYCAFSTKKMSSGKVELAITATVSNYGNFRWSTLNHREQIPASHVRAIHQKLSFIVGVCIKRYNMKEVLEPYFDAAS